MTLPREEVDKFLASTRKLCDLVEERRDDVRFAIVAVGYKNKVQWNGSPDCDTVYIALGTDGADHPANLWLAMGQKMHFVDHD